MTRTEILAQRSKWTVSYTGHRGDKVSYLLIYRTILLLRCFAQFFKPRLTSLNRLLLTSSALLLHPICTLNNLWCKFRGTVTKRQLKTAQYATEHKFEFNVKAIPVQSIKDIQ